MTLCMYGNRLHTHKSVTSSGLVLVGSAGYTVVCGGVVTTGRASWGVEARGHGRGPLKSG